MKTKNKESTRKNDQTVFIKVEKEMKQFKRKEKNKGVEKKEI